MTRSGWTETQDKAYLAAFEGKTENELSNEQVAIMKQLNAMDNDKAVLIHKYELLRRAKVKLLYPDFSESKASEP